ncbi:MAG: nucleoside diphosphate kinase regulator [Bacteroidetes bacterium]|nr:nucleoside diphosphate kinase regulator [Bacteroidota bacterium]
MDSRKIYITERDKAKLKKLFASTIGFRNLDLKNLKVLLYELERAEVVTSEDLTKDVITMNSTVRVKDLDSGSEFTYTLVYPEDANSDENKISILAPIGTALLGYSVGDIIEWAVPAGKRRLEVKEIIYQESMVHEQK